jgi:uncharacterized protein YbjT (DUF2867 family)
MRVAVVGGTGRIGRHAVAALRRAGQELSVLARSSGIDVSTGAGLDAALDGVDAVVDCFNVPAANTATARAVFGGEMQTMLSGAKRAGVRHYALLSIVGIDRIPGAAHWAGKREQEAVLTGETVPWSILRATQFHEFAAMAIEWTRRGDVVTVPPVLMQPVETEAVGDALAELVIGAPTMRRAEIAGPERIRLDEMVRLLLAARRDSATVRASWQDAMFGDEASGEQLLPGAGARVVGPAFSAWAAPAPRPGR